MEVASHYLRNGTPIIATLCDCSKAFDKCRFDLLFEKMLARDVPAIIVRCLNLIYVEQVAWVKWGDKKSSTFTITNGTRQGAVLSPIFWCLYCDAMLKELRKLGVGCHLGGKWVGATMYADDLILMAPTRSAMVAMLKVCEKYAREHNISFTTDPNPAKSKTKCLYMCGNMNTRKYPAYLQLNGSDLPFVTTATHLGHELSQDCTMAQDTKIKRASFIDRSTNIREMFEFANLEQVLKTIVTYYCDHYGSMLWDLYSESSWKYFRCWNTCVKLAWKCPRSTHTYFVTNALARGIATVRTRILSRYTKFVKSLLLSDSPEVVAVANTAVNDRGSTTGANLYKIQEETGLNPLSTTSPAVMHTLAQVDLVMPKTEEWRIPFLMKLLASRHDLEKSCDETKHIDWLIESLCST